MKYIEPTFNKDKFTCPHCNTVTEQKWANMIVAMNFFKDNSGSKTIQDRIKERYNLENLQSAQCNYCKNYSLWIDEKRIYPRKTNIPEPNEDMPDDIKKDYIEASIIVEDSPRCACSLLRLALQKLMSELGEKGKDLNEDIGNLVKKGLDVKIQKALDSIRIIGNESVHPSEFILVGDYDTAKSLFKILNIIVKEMISQPKEIDELFNQLPKNKINGIENRDKN